MESSESEAYYYYRDKAKRPVVTICLLRDGMNIGRGMAICSNEDSPCKEIGRDIARKRAVKAILGERHALPICSHRACDALIEVDPLFSIFDLGAPKAAFNPALDAFETKILSS